MYMGSIARYTYVDLFCVQEALGAIKTANARLLRHHKAETLDLYKPQCLKRK